MIEEILADRISHYYAVSDWNPQFYVELAHLGMIAVTHGEKYLLPEMQRKYSVLNLDKLHVFSRSCKQLRKDKDKGLKLRFNHDLEATFKGLDAQWKNNNWLNQPYKKLLRSLLDKRTSVGNTEFFVQSAELYIDDGDGKEKLVAGEVGYTIGKVYTSLTGFCAEGQHYGTTQLMALGLVMRASGYAFWNLGHPWRAKSKCMMYKKDLGGVIVRRDEFRRRWVSATEPEQKGTKLPCLTLSGEWSAERLLELASELRELQKDRAAAETAEIREREAKRLRDGS